MEEEKDFKKAGETYMNNTKPMTLTKTDFQAVARGGLIFAAPLALLYLTQVTATLQSAGHAVSLKDFIPSTFTMGAVALYATNRLTDLIRKFVA